MSTQKFLTKDKWLTYYALACGYIEISNDSSTRFYMEHNVFHVRAFCFWESFNSIVDARKCFKNKLKKSGLKRVINEVIA